MPRKSNNDPQAQHDSNAAATDNRRVQVDRRKNPNGTPPPGTVVDRRLGIDRRDRDAIAQSLDNADNTTGLERKRGRGRRLSEFTKSAEEGEMTTEQFLFLMAIEAFKKSNDRMFPTWSDVLEVVRLLGYRKTMPAEINLPNADDWSESPTAPSNVRPDRWAERFTDDEHRAMKKSAAPTNPKPGKDDKPADPSSINATQEALDALEELENAFGDLDPDSSLDDLLTDD